MKIFKTNSKVPTIESMTDSDLFEDIQEFYDFYLESIKDRLKKKKDYEIKSEIRTPNGLSMECILDRENYHKTLIKCEEYFVSVEQYEKAAESLKLLKKLK